MNMMKRLVVPAVFGLALASAASAAARPAVTADRDAAEVVKKVIPSVVRVETQNHVRRVATGIVIDKDGYILTTALVSPRNEKVSVTTADGRKLEAEFIGFDVETRVALVRAKDKNLTAIAAGKAEEMAPGSWVAVVGFSPENTPAVAQGIVSSVGADKLRLNIWVTPGSSGGPVVNEKGQMVGLLRGIYTEERPIVFNFRDREQTGLGYVFSQAEAPSSGMALAVPVNLVMDIAGQLRDKKTVERGWLGVGIALNEKGQVVISEVDEKSPAELAKLQEGDVIISLDGKDINNPDALAAEVRGRKPGREATLKLERDGKTLEVKVRLGQYPEEEARRELETRFPRIFPPETVFRVKPEQKIITAPRTPLLPLGRSRYIGVYCDELTPELAAHFGVKEGRALIVSRLTEKGPAEKAGIKVGDVIFRVDGKKVESINDLIDIIQDRKEGEKVKVELLREKKALTVEVEIGEQELDGFFNQERLRNYLESFREYAGRMEQEARKWQDQYSVAFRENMKKINEELQQVQRKWRDQYSPAIRENLKKVEQELKEAQKQAKKADVRIVGVRKV